MAALAELHDRLRDIADARMTADPAHDLAHLDRVWVNARTIADERTDLRVLVAACYLHDLVNLPKNAPDRHLASRQSAEQAAPILADLGYSDPEIRAAQHAIAAHSFSARIPPETPEARILRDADRLDALGAIGIARNFSVAGSLGRALYDPADPFAENRPLDDLQFSIDHWKVKLLSLPSDMLTDGGKAMAQDRVNRMLHFLDAFAEEIGCPLPPGWTAG
ncbi:HD domain-containing protein [Ruegeria sediminis]|uniref:HD domain-containing protein n=1 Tax=Ruegeria sediminis TaxID=2583820 RepID=A0ABY2WU62_9RHOB|nr:HD domain-containing protein [Ruegeria sediminis]TMV05555.1 HD domain-containing protein [Ruegeria sediminis]